MAGVAAEKRQSRRAREGVLKTKNPRGGAGGRKTTNRISPNTASVCGCQEAISQGSGGRQEPSTEVTGGSAAWPAGVTAGAGRSKGRDTMPPAL
jgi:hypothetical protein